MFAFENQVIALLSKELAEFDVQKEVSTGVYPVDLYLPNHKLCIEIDGSSHFYGLTEHEMKKSKFKYWLFDKAGFDTIRINYHKYKSNQKSEHGGFAIKEKELIDDVRKAVAERQLEVRGKDVKGFFTKVLQS